jgi:hypothetical protein
MRLGIMRSFQADIPGGRLVSAERPGLVDHNPFAAMDGFFQRFFGLEVLNGVR